VEMFQIIMEECAKWNLCLDPKYLHLDFESAVIEAIKGAVKEVIGVHVNVRGCFYHLCQSTFRKVQKLRFVTIFKRDEEFWKHCGMVDALAFLPWHLVEKGKTYLKKQFTWKSHGSIRLFWCIIMANIKELEIMKIILGFENYHQCTHQLNGM